MLKVQPRVAMEFCAEVSGPRPLQESLAVDGGWSPQVK